MKKILSIFLSFMMMAGGISASASFIDARMNLNTTKEKELFYDSGQTAFQVTEECDMAQLVKTEDKINSVTVRCPSYSNAIGKLTLKIFKWMGDYASTVKQKPLKTQEFVDFNDGAYLKMDLTDIGLQGDFLLVLTNPEERVGVWAMDCVEKESYVMFENGVQVPNKAFWMSYSAVARFVAEEPDVSKAFDAYSPINLSKFEQVYQMKETHINEATMQKTGVMATEANAPGYARYVVDFGSESPKGATLEVYNTLTESSRVQIIADNPITGTILCEFDAEIEGKLSFAEVIPAPINEKITGIHNIYVVQRHNGLHLAELTFTKETPPLSKTAQRLADFEATKDFEIKSTWSDTWTATDMLGRKLPDYREAGEFNPDKKVGIFFWTWHSNRGSRTSLSRGINQRVINSYPGPESDIKNDYYYSGWNQTGVWNESIYGLYHGFDTWVMRKQMELLSAAGVDAMFCDATNGTNTYTGGALLLCKELHKMHLEGIETPDFAFMLPFFDMNNNVVDLERIYENIYSKGLYSDCWFYWRGKPVVMGYPDNLVYSTGSEEVDAQHKEILDFFTFRPGQPDYRKGQYHEDQWPWLEVYPQHPYGESEKYGCECVSVGIAMNGNDNGLDAMNGKDIYGRSFTYKDRFSKLSDKSKFYGYNFTEQWSRAHELDAEYVFVTGWNEWTAGHQEKWGQGTLGAYPDQYSDEYSRDIEPTTGDMKDVYYYLLAKHIRMFKGVRPTPEASAEKTIAIDGDFAQWSDVGPEFIGLKGGTETRDDILFNNGKVYNDTGRNDIVLSKVARDSDNIYFYVKTAEELTPYTDPAWMRLLINTDRTYRTGWEGYDFVINNVNPTEKTATLEKWAGTDVITHWKWEKVADVNYRLQGNEMMISVPRSALGLNGSLDFEFKWYDNMQHDGYIMDVYNYGDTAPIGRYAYHYTEDFETSKKPVDEPVDPEEHIEFLTRRFMVTALDRNWAYVYGKRTDIDDQSDVTAPMIINDKTMVPVRFIAEQLGATVEWKEETQSVRILAKKRITLTLNSRTMQVEKEKRTLQSPATEVENRIYVPLRDIMEALEMEVHWIEPGVILVGPASEMAKLYVNGGIEKILEAYNMN